MPYFNLKREAKLSFLNVLFCNNFVGYTIGEVRKTILRTFDIIWIVDSFNMESGARIFLNESVYAEELATLTFVFQPSESVFFCFGIADHNYARHSFHGHEN
jgi:hypothetical protein